jgi:GT2 family glycosyltransferase
LAHQGHGSVTTNTPAASIVIVTKDRRDEALRAVASAVRQKPPVEVLLIDDGSTDGTAEIVRDAFPSARVERFETSAGYIVRRNTAAGMTDAPVLVSIDDDAEFAADDVVARTVSEFEDPVVGAVAMPYVDLLEDRTVRQSAPDGDRPYATYGFRGTAYAVRRALFARLGGFREHFFHQAEEPDFCLRLLATGHVVRLGRAEPIRHHVSPKRDVERMWFYGCRNDILFAWHNVPLPYLPGRIARVAAYSLWLGLGVRRPGLFARGVIAGLRACFRTKRQPVSRRDYRLYHELRKREAVPLDEVRARLSRSEVRS